MNLQDEQIKIMNLPLVVAANNDGNYAQLLKGYVLPQHTKKDIDLIFSVLDDKGKIAFKQGFVNQFIGNTDKVKNLYKTFDEFDKETAEYVLGTSTYRSIEQIANFSRQMADSNIDKILDTHLGSGSIALACHNLKFDLVACELDKEYYNAAIKRIEQHKAQKRIF